jgi:hypothetical protein
MRSAQLAWHYLSLALLCAREHGLNGKVIGRTTAQHGLAFIDGRLLQQLPPTGELDAHFPGARCTDR